MKQSTITQTIIDSAKLSATATLLKKDLIALQKGETISVTAKELTANFSKATKAQKLSMTIGQMKETASAKGRQFGYMIADSVKLDQAEAIRFVEAVYMGMEQADIRNEPKKVVKISLLRAINTLYEGSAKLEISDGKGQPLTVTITDVDPVAELVEQLEKTMIKAAGLLDTLGEVAYQTSGGIELKTGVKAAVSVLSRDVAQNFERASDADDVVVPMTKAQIAEDAISYRDSVKHDALAMLALG